MAQMSEALITVAATISSGGLTAIASYFAVASRLSNRVSALEERVETLQQQTELIRKAGEDLDDAQSATRTEMTNLRVKVTELLTDHSDRILERLNALADEQSKHRQSCIEQAGQAVSRQYFEQYAREEERRWQEFYRAVGKLEAVLDRALTDTPKLVRRPPPPTQTP